MASAKLVQISKDIDAARCNGNWAAIPELARRYKKYNSEGIILEQTILAEASLSQLCQSARQQQQQQTIDYQEKALRMATLEARLDPEQVRSIQQQLRNVIQLPDQDDTFALQKEFAIIVLTRSHFECGEYEQAIELVNKLSFTKDQVSQGYGLVLFLQARIIKAISYELSGDMNHAIETYEGVESLVAEYPNTKYKLWIEWAEMALYRAVLLGLTNKESVDVSSLLGFIRQYQRIVNTQANNWRIDKRMVLTRHAIQFVSNSYRTGQYVPPGGLSEDDHEICRQSFIAELSQLHAIYEKMLYMQVPMPRAGQVNQPVLDFVNQLMADFELMGTTTQDLRGLREVLDRAAQRTFNSPSITRHLYNTLYRLGEYDEAEYALRSYLHLVDLISYDWTETHKNGDALAIDRDGISMTIPTARPDLPEDNAHDESDCIGDIKNVESEQVTDMLQVLITAIRMYCNDLAKSVDAVEMAEIAKELYQKNKTKIPISIAAYLHRAIGVAYGLLGCQTFDPEVRPIYHEKALSYLKQSLEIDNQAWETYYQLALQQAEMHDIGQAIQSITHALQTNPSHLPSWHLLTLIVSCPIQGDFKQALKTCEIGLQQVELKDDYDEAEQFILFQMTHTWLLYALNGPEAALTSSGTLFSSYGKIAVVPEASQSSGQEMIISGSFGNLSDLQGQKKNRGRSSSSATTATGILKENGSRSHDLSTASIRTGRARSASNLASKAPSLGPSTGLLSVPDNGSTGSKHHHGLHLFGSRSTSHKPKGTESPQGSVNGNMSAQSLSAMPYDSKANNSVSSFQSVAPSVMSGQSILQPSYIPMKPTKRAILRKQRSERILSDLWLLTAQQFIKLGKLDEARKAVGEAERVDWTHNPMVWCVLGQLLLAGKKDIEEAQAAFDKALVIDPHHVMSRLELAKSYLLLGNNQMAEGLLDSLTKSNGWDCAEAWFLLGEICKNTDRLERTKACLFYALELESTAPIQPFSILPRFI